MTHQSNLSSVTLQPCCMQVLETIRGRIKLGKLLQGLILPTVFVSLFVSPTDSAGRGGAVSTIIFISQTDWVKLTEITRGIPLIQRTVITKDAQWHALGHVGKLQDFWIALADSFR